MLKSRNLDFRFKGYVRGQGSGYGGFQGLKRVPRLFHAKWRPLP